MKTRIDREWCDMCHRRTCPQCHNCDCDGYPCIHQDPNGDINPYNRPKEKNKSLGPGGSYPGLGPEFD